MATEYLRIEIDDADTLEKIETLRNNMSKAQFERAMHGVFRRTERHIAVILKKDLPPQYYVKPSAVGSAVKRERLTANGMGCTIPVQAKRGGIGTDFRSSGSARGWASLHKNYRVKARIVKAGVSTLPVRIGGYKPFRNSAAARLKGVYVRTTKAQYPIKKVMGIAIPQMPMNRSQASVQADVAKYVNERVNARIGQLIRVGK